MKLRKESLLTTTKSESPGIERRVVSTPETGTNNAPVLIEARVVFSPIRKGYREIGDIVREYEDDSDKSVALSRARIALSEELAKASEASLAVLRMRKGLSQKALADRIGTSQSRLSRIECGMDDILLSTFEKLVVALDVSRDVLAESIRNCRRHND